MKINDFKKTKKNKVRADKITSITISIEQYAYIKKNNIDFSRLVRAMLDEIIKNDQEKTK